MPASNMKLVTAAVAAARLGWTRTLETRLVAAGPIEHGVLKGDLLIEGSGDPSFAGRPGPGPSVIDDWAGHLAAAGITAVDGRIVGNDDALDDEGLGRGWAWDNLAYGCSTPAGGLAFNENAVLITVTPGPAAGTPAVVTLVPDVGVPEVTSVVTTGEAGSRTSLEYAGSPDRTLSRSPVRSLWTAGKLGRRFPWTIRRSSLRRRFAARSSPAASPSGERRSMPTASRPLRSALTPTQRRHPGRPREWCC